MKKNKKIFIVLVSLIVIIFLVIFFVNSISKRLGPDKDSGIDNQKTSFLEETLFEEREEIIKNYIAEKFNVSHNLVTIFIARESEGHINGIFIIGDQEDNPKTGYFFGVIDKKIDIVWAEENFPDCSIIKDYNFPVEMAPTCF